MVPCPDGRELAVCEWGDPAGAPVMELHGTPGSRLSRHHDEGAYRRAGVRAITYDRPGYGRSPRQPGRTVASAALDVAAVADALAIDTFAVVGWSGGGPHDRELLEALESGEGLGSGYELPDSDRESIAAPDRRRVLLEATREALAPGGWGSVDDDVAFTQPWGFDPAAITVPTQIWFGEEDTLVPAHHGRWLADHIPGAQRRVLREGHLAADEYVQELYSWLAAG